MVEPWPCGNLDPSHDGEHCRTCWLLLDTDGRPLEDHERSRLTAGEVRERADEYDAMEADRDRWKAEAERLREDR